MDWFRRPWAKRDGISLVPPLALLARHPPSLSDAAGPLTLRWVVIAPVAGALVAIEINKTDRS